MKRIIVFFALMVLLVSALPALAQDGGGTTQTNNEKCMECVNSVCFVNCVDPRSESCQECINSVMKEECRVECSKKYTGPVDNTGVLPVELLGYKLTAQDFLQFMQVMKEMCAAMRAPAAGAIFIWLGFRRKKAVIQVQDESDEQPPQART